MRDKKQCITAGIIIITIAVGLFFVLTGRTEYTPFSVGNNLAENNAEQKGNAGFPVVEQPDPMTFSHTGGFYEEAFYLSISTADEEGTIYYTLDGSEPKPENVNNYAETIGYRGRTFIYTEPIYIPLRNKEKTVFAKIPSGPFMPELPDEEIFKATVISAKVIGRDAELSGTMSATYFVGDGVAQRYTLPVISIITDENNLFGGDNGIYVPGDACVDFNESTAHYFQRGSEWERPIHIEFYERNKDMAFSEKAGIRIHGGYNRQTFQKSFRIYMRNSYGSQWLNYELFRDTPFQTNHLDEFKRFILRSAASEGYQTIIRDGFMQTLVEHMNIDVQSYRPANVFLNGEYWGMYNIRERLDKYYVASHHGADPDNIDFITNPSVTLPVPNENIDEGDGKHYSEMIQFMLINDMSQDINYKVIEKMMDIDNYVDYQVAQIYFANFDWPQNNVKIWRPRTSDGKWRWMMFDVDAGFLRAPNRETYSYGHSNPDFNALEHATAEVHDGLPKIPEYTFVFRTLLKNEAFRHAFINRFADCLNTCFVGEHVVNQIDMMVEHVSHDIPEYKMRWGYPREWEEMLEAMRLFARERPSHQRQHIAEFFHLDGTAQVTVVPDSNGIIQINSIGIHRHTEITDGDEWTGTYFRGVPVQIKAIPGIGYKFAGWEGMEETNEPSLTLNLQGDTTIKAVFRPE